MTAAPSSVSIVTAEEIRLYGYTTLGEILGSVRGLYTTYDRDYSFIGVRGFQRPGDYNMRTLILVDGHRLNDNIYQSVLIGTDGLLNVDDIERVEVIRGPSSSIYGAGAFFAVIDIVTRGGAGLHGFESSAGAASYDTTSGRLAYGAKTQAGAEVMLSGSAYGSGGQDLFYKEYDAPATNNGVAVDSDVDRSGRFFGKLSFHDLTVEAAYSSREKRIPTGEFATLFDDPRNRTLDARGFVDLKYAHELSAKAGLLARVYEDRYYYRGTYTYPPPSDVYVEHAWADTRGAEVQMNARLGARNRLVTGGEYRAHVRQDFDARDGCEADSADWGLFLQDEFAPSRHISFNAGVRYDQYPTFGGSTNPRLGMIWSPQERTTLKFLYGQAFRAPSTYELYYSGLANPALDPETIRTLEVVLEQYVGGGLRLSGSLFRNRIGHLISLSTVSGLFDNIETVDSDGVELELERTWRDGPSLRVDYALQDTRDRANDSRLSDSPRQLAKLHLALPLAGRKLSTGAEVQYTGPRLTLLGDEIGGFTVANLTFLGRDLGGGVEISAGVYNLLDKRYAYPTSAGFLQDALEQDGRHYRLKLTWRF